MKKAYAQVPTSEQPLVEGEEQQQQQKEEEEENVIELEGEASHNAKAAFFRSLTLSGLFALFACGINAGLNSQTISLRGTISRER